MNATPKRKNFVSFQTLPASCERDLSLYVTLTPDPLSVRVTDGEPPALVI